MNVGKNFYDQGQTNAIGAFEKAVALQPANPDAHLDLANAFMLANLNERALQEAKEVLSLDPQSAAARYVAGSASLHLSHFEDAIKYLQECLDIDAKVNAVSYQLARAQQSTAHFAEAAELLRSVLQWEPKHPSAHYVLSQVLVRLGQTQEAQQEAQQHAAILAENQGHGPNPERCVYTEARVPFVLEQPVAQGVKVTFSDMTLAAFGTNAARYHGPAGVLDIDQRGQNDLFVREGEGGFLVLLNTNGVFQPLGPKLPGLPGSKYTRCLVGDLNNDRYDDVVMLSEQGIQIFKFATNGAFADATTFAGMKGRTGIDGALVDLDLAGKLDLLVLSPTNREVRLLRNLGPMYFKDVTATSGIPAALTGVRQIIVDDWNGDDLMDLFAARDGQPPELLIKQRGGPLAPTNSPASWPAGSALAVGDLNNDFRTDLVIAAPGKLEVRYGGMDQQFSLPLGDWPVSVLKLVDYDNDGWLDILAAGDGVRIWRNLGQAGFREMTQELGLDKLKKGRILSVNAADFDQDGDTDLLLALESGGLQMLRNEGGNANHQLKLRLQGNRSNASGLGVRVEVKAASWHTLRTVAELPVEIGLGKYDKPEVINAHWSDVSIPVNFEFKADPKVVWNLMEIELPPGSCPFLYAWDGERFRFVTDILGGSPMGLHVSDERLVDADPEEYVWIGDDSRCRPLNGNYTMQVTSEMREVLFLDEAKLAVVDHPAGTEVHSTSKMRPGKPFPPSELVTLQHRQRLLQATRSDGLDVTAQLAEMDGQVVSPIKPRAPQLRGLAEPYSVIFDFGPLAVDRPLVLALTGWLRFGGGMANVAASHDPALPFPFPILEVETTDGAWKAVDVVVGVPCGKTKTILVDLTGKLPAGARRLRLSMAFELHWDRIALFERADGSSTRIFRSRPSQTDLHWHGFGEYETHPWFVPLTPIHDRVSSNAKWRITPAGWCTRYGPVDELVAKRDDALVLINGGDELTLSFPANALPDRPPGFVRDFFFYSVGWEKDSDPHVEKGAEVEPLPFHGMDDQLYGRQNRPVIDGDWWIKKYNTRWVGPLTLTRTGH
jgi:tetratricopeptide (TPR) repeat protein